MKPHTAAGLLLSSLAGSVHSYGIPTHDCASTCSRNLLHSYDLADTKTLCNDMAKQRELFLCLSSSCRAKTYGPALAHTISECSQHGASISKLFPVELPRMNLAQREVSPLAPRFDISHFTSGNQLTLAVDCTAGSDGVLTLSIPEAPSPTIRPSPNGDPTVSGPETGDAGSPNVGQDPPAGITPSNSDGPPGGLEGSGSGSAQSGSSVNSVPGGAGSDGSSIDGSDGLNTADPDCEFENGGSPHGSSGDQNNGQPQPRPQPASDTDNSLGGGSSSADGPPGNPADGAPSGPNTAPATPIGGTGDSSTHNNSDAGAGNTVGNPSPGASPDTPGQPGGAVSPSSESPPTSPDNAIDCLVNTDNPACFNQNQGSSGPPVSPPAPLPPANGNPGVCPEHADGSPDCGAASPPAPQAPAPPSKPNPNSGPDGDDPADSAGNSPNVPFPDDTNGGNCAEGNPAVACGGPEAPPAPPQPQSPPSDGFGPDSGNSPSVPTSPNPPSSGNTASPPAIPDSSSPGKGNTNTTPNADGYPCDGSLGPCPGAPGSPGNRPPYDQAPWSSPVDGDENGSTPSCNGNCPISPNRGNPLEPTNPTSPQSPGYPGAQPSGGPQNPPGNSVPETSPAKGNEDCDDPKTNCYGASNNSNDSQGTGQNDVNPQAPGNPIASVRPASPATASAQATESFIRAGPPSQSTEFVQATRPADAPGASNGDGGPILITVIAPTKIDVTQTRVVTV
ncbi:hypothetical protein FZEAL_10447 [Fusarium zealandicum]|uniref:Uncharacterized protein n=1 Tax=Fusarium zealandicum TaxID=1053134 RepID=A0A8H4XB81_9HYPO|nr:hypothetical protein FZEAL_10447 [Fusarium zealandicum]